MADDPIQFGVVTDVGSVANALAAIFKMGDDIFNVLNSPNLLAARKRSDVQAILNQWDADLKAAQASGDITKIDAESSG